MRILLALALACLLARLATAPEYVQDHDGFYFSRAVERYSVAEMRPHWPGYPVYVWSGKLLRLFTGDARQALRLLSILASTLSLFPIAWLAGAWRRSLGGTPDEAERAGLGAALVWSLSPLPWFVGTELSSDALGLLIGLGVLLLCWRSVAEPDGRPLIAAAALAGLLLGTRLAYLSLLLPLAWAAWQRRRQSRLFAAAAVALLASVSVWLGWQVAVDGPRLFSIARGHIVRHVLSPGTTVAGDVSPWGRPASLLRSFSLYGLGSWWPGAALSRLPATLILVGLTLAALARLAKAHAGRPGVLPWLWAGPYLLGILLAFEAASFPRYCLPLVALASLVAGLGLPAGGRAAGAVLAALVLAMGVVVVPLAIGHGKAAPVEWQFTRYVAARFDPVRTVILVHESDAPALGLYLAAEAQAFAVAPADTDGTMAARFEGLGRTVLSTAPTISAPGEWTPLARFCRPPEISPRGPFDLWIFRHDAGGGSFSETPGCQ